MALVDNVPFLEYIFKYLQKNDIKKVVLSVGYRWQSIEKYFGYRWQNIEIFYSIEDTPLGTGGAIKKAISYVEGEDVFVTNGDTLFDIDLAKMVLKKDSKLLIALKRMKDFDRYGSVEYDKNGYITKFLEKQYTKIGNINGGVYLMKSNIFSAYSMKDSFSFETFMQTNFKSLNATSIVFEDYFIDIGIPSDYKKAQKELSRKNLIIC